jgi:hypothetical protein
MSGVPCTDKPGKSTADKGFGCTGKPLDQYVPATYQRYQEQVFYLLPEKHDFIHTLSYAVYEFHYII